VFCEPCKDGIKPLVSQIIPLTTTKKLTVFALGAYKGPLRSLVLRKMVREPAASEQLAHLMLEELPFETYKPDYLVPIPLHWTRYAWRGYNQADVMARLIAKKRSIPMLSLLKRVRRTVIQAGLTYKERQRNVAKVFVTSQKNTIEGKHVLLVDDLCTTGATLKNAAHALLPLRPARITAVVACRVI